MKPLLRVDATDGQVRLLGVDGRTWLAACDAGVVLADGSALMVGDRARPETGVDGLVVRLSSRGEAPELRWHFQPRPKDQALALWLEVYNATGDPLDIARLDVLVAPLGAFGGPPSTAVAHQLSTAEGNALLAGFTGGGAQAGVIDTAEGRLHAHTTPPKGRLNPGGTLASELLLLVLDQPIATADRLLAAEIEAERAVWGN